jgi:hypothetical protein
MGLVVRVVIEPGISPAHEDGSLPATSPAMIPSEVVRAAALVADPALFLSSNALISSSIVSSKFKWVNVAYRKHSKPRW